MIVSFTGHRPDKLGGYWILGNQTYKNVCEDIHKALTELRPDHAILGMALGVDQWAAEICTDLRIPWTAALPFEGQESRWPVESQQKYWALVQKAARVFYVSEPGYSPAKMQLRNEWMVDNSDVLLAVWDGTDGGTANCVRYAESVGRRIYRIHPRP